MSVNPEDLQGPHPDPPVDENLEVQPEDQTSPQGPHPDPPVDDDALAGSDEPDASEDVDERSKQSFPTSDPPATWAGPDQA